jgi:hypothetical protein
LKDDSSPLDGQREKTRVWHIPVGRQREITSRRSALPCSAVPQNALCFFPILFVKLFVRGARQTFCRFFIFSVSTQISSKSFKMNGPENIVFCRVSPVFLATQLF